MTNYHLLAVSTKTYLNTLANMHKDNKRTSRSRREGFSRLSRESRTSSSRTHSPQSVQLVIPLLWRICRCLLFEHASLFDRHFRMPVRTVWKICWIPWTSVRWGGMSLMYASGRAPRGVTSFLRCVLRMENTTDQCLTLHTLHILWITAGYWDARESYMPFISSGCVWRVLTHHCFYKLPFASQLYSVLHWAVCDAQHADAEPMDWYFWNKCEVKRKEVMRVTVWEV